MPTDAERVTAYEACVSAQNNNLLKQSLPFIEGVLSGNPNDTADGWLDTLKAQMNNPATPCLDLLTDDQKNRIMQTISDRVAAGYGPGVGMRPINLH